jgi:pyruvate formate lyase activating enzyme
MSKEIPPEKVVIRIPFIPGVNGDRASIVGMAKYLKRLRAEWLVHLLPYHCLGERKYRLIGRDYPFKDVYPPTEEEIEKGIRYFRRWHLDAEVIR